MLDEFRKFMQNTMKKIFPKLKRKQQRINMKNTTDNIQNTNRGSNGGQTTSKGASNA